MSLLYACAGGAPPADPRAAIRARLPIGTGSAPTEEVVTEQVLLGQLPAACAGLRARVQARAGGEVDGDADDWPQLLQVSARMGARADGCLPLDAGDALADWSADLPRWRGARAEWLAARGRIPEAEALLAAPGDDAARLRVALAKGDGEGAQAAAEGAVIEEPRDVLACRTLGLAALAAGDAAWAIEQSACGGIGARAPELLRLRGDALDLAGEYAAAEAVYQQAGADVHRAALLYQEFPTPERRAAAERLLAPGPDGPPPPAALHAVWLALVEGGPPSLVGLDQSVPATIARAVVRGAREDETALSNIPGAPAAVARARLAAARGDRSAMEAALAAALEASPAAEPVHRARVALRVAFGGDVDGALADWAAQDPDHVALVGTRGSRDVPWVALVPEQWEDLARLHPDPRMTASAPAGTDAVGARFRAACALPTPAARADALEALGAEIPGLDALPAERYRRGPPTGTRLDLAP